MKTRTIFILSLIAIITLAAGSAYGAYSGGTGEPNNPYQIANKDDLLYLGANTGDYGKSFIMTADIDMEGQVFTMAIIAADTISGSGFQGTSFTGTFDGSGHKITHFAINGGSNWFLGLFGYVHCGTVKNLGVENCAVNGASWVGGLMGYEEYGIISNCYSTGVVSGDSLVGGLVGRNAGSMSNCYSTGAVSGSSAEVGGLVGENVSSISNCYSTGAVSGSYDVGGLVGYNWGGSISNCYSTGAVSGTSSPVGGLVGYKTPSGSVDSSFWDTQTSGQTTSAGGTGKTTALMKTKGTFTDVGWDFLTIWNIVEGQTYPFFKRAGYGGGAGTSGDPYRIARTEDLLSLAANVTDYNKCFILTADIDTQGRVFTTAIIAADTVGGMGFDGTYFTGTFDGNGHKITNFTINGLGNNYIGLFGAISSSGLVKDLGLENCAVSGSNRVAVLVGGNSGNISNCYSTGAVSGSSLVGGLIGYKEYGTISNCYSTGAVSGDGFVGGLVGYNSGGNISDCYSIGAVSGTFDVGGLVGINYSSISNCYLTGAVSGDDEVGGLMGRNTGGSVNNSFWDTQTSGQTTSAGGTGKTTAQMKTLSTFTSSGWDFVDMWGIGNGQTYPYLKLLGINPADINYSGTVDFVDFAILAENWLEGTEP
ncbi:MAG: GLUG motif-containing protein [Planctomycetota bacterium]